MRATLWQRGLAFLAVLLAGSNARAADVVPFPAALDAAAIRVDRLDSVLDYALLIGNGDLNALVYTERGQLKLNLTKNDVWDARLDAQRDPPLPTIGLVKKWAFDRGGTSVQNGSVILDEGVQWAGPDSYHAHPYPCPRICGRLILGAASTEPTSSSARLDVRRAVATVEGNDRGIPRTTVRALADRNVILVDQGNAGRLEAARSQDLPESEQERPDSDVQTILQRIPGDGCWPGMSFAVALVTRGPRQAAAIVTSREAADPKAAAIKLAGDAVAAAPDALVKTHEAVWERFWAKSGLELDDPVLRSLWYRNLYFLRCVVKPGVVSPGLFASLVSDGPAWHGDYHTNYNIQSTYWPVYSSNHPELSEPYDRLIVDYMPRARWLCKELFGFEGAYIPHVLFAFEPPPETCQGPTRRQYIHHVWGWTLGVAGFSAQPVWWHYKYAPSRELLEQVAYPVVRDVADFQANFVEICDKTPDGKIVLAPTVSPEHWGWTKRFERNRNGAFCLGMFRYLFEAAIEGARTLGRDADKVARWRKAVALLPDYPLSAEKPPVVVDVQDAPPTNYNISVPATPVFPGDVVTYWSPQAQRELFSRTIGQMRWNGNNSAIMLSVSRARLSMPETLPWVREELTARLRPNGTLTLNRNEPRYGFNRYGHYTEQFAASLAINELLLQSVADVVRVFPAWPLDKPARFQRLRTQGGFLVSAACERGKVGPVLVESTAGGRLRLFSPWPAITVVGPEGRTNSLTPDRAGIVELDTQPGQTFEFR